jgi:inner membrane protein
MMGKTHLAAGAAAGLAVARSAGLHDPALLALCTVAGGLAGLVPDWLQINLPGAGEQIKGLFGHRGFTHWLWSALAAGWLVYQVAPIAVAGAMLAGWLSHLALDCLADGIPLLWPLGRITVAHIKTGSWMDKLFGGAAVVVMAVIAVGWR